MRLSRKARKELRSLSTRKGRRAQQSFLAEGVRVLEEALRHGVLPRRLYICPEALDERGAAAVKGFSAQGVPVEFVLPEDMEAITETRTPQPLAAVFHFQSTALDSLEGRWPRRLLALDGITDPGNLGTLLRSALAFGQAEVAVLGEGADPHAPKVVRSSAGALFALDLVRGSAGDLAQAAHAHGATLLVTTLDGKADDAVLEEALSAARLVIVIGSEASGVSPELHAAAQHRWRIAHEPTVESLNAAVAGSILLHELHRRGT